MGYVGGGVGALKGKWWLCSLNRWDEQLQVEIFSK